MNKRLLTFFSMIIIFSTMLWSADKAQAVIIFDASGSMWGQIDGKAKITIAKEALNNVVGEWNPNVELGLTAYGHRKKGDCNDIETLVPVGAVDKNKITSLVQKIQPKGKTPIARSLKRVAEELKFTEEKATIILISDGKESCDANPCDVAKELEKKGIDFVTHVIGFNVDKKTDKQLECIADATGGEYFSAKNATALNDAMKTIVKKVEKVEPKPTPKPTPKKLKKSLEITATEKEGGKWVDANHDIYKQDEEKKLGERMTSSFWSKRKKPALQKLPVGKYILVSHYNKFKKETPFEIKAEEMTKLNVIMGQTGDVALSCAEKEGAKWVQCSHMIYKNENGKAVGSSLVYSNSSKSKPLNRQLPVGEYIVKTTYNRFKKETPFEIKSGEETQLHVIFDKFTIHAKCADPNSRVYYEIYASSGQLVHEVSLHCSKRLKLNLDKGNYSIEAKVKNSTKEAKFTIGGGSNTLSLDLSNLNHEEEIKADSKNNIDTSTKPAKKDINLGELGAMLDKVGKESNGSHASELKELGGLLKGLGGLLGGTTNASESKAKNDEADKEFEEMSKDLDMFSK